jgi:hypothetical protein
MPEIDHQTPKLKLIAPVGPSHPAPLRRGRLTVAWQNRLWSFAALLARLRAARPQPHDLARHDWPTQTRGRGVRMSEWLRDRLRWRWLRPR